MKIVVFESHAGHSLYGGEHPIRVTPHSHTTSRQPRRGVKIVDCKLLLLYRSFLLSDSHCIRGDTTRMEHSSYGILQRERPREWDRPPIIIPGFLPALRRETKSLIHLPHPSAAL